jgi:UDP-2-acetamido-3-amino-2,3-dideoxy-glucuronate N-acetyltransferase
MRSETLIKTNIHKLSDVQSHKIGANTYIWQFSVVLEGAEIGENCNVNCNCFIENEVKIGNNVTIKSGVQIWDGITLEDNVFIGPNVTFTNDHVPRSKVHPGSFSKTLIRKGASIGANCTIISGVVVGEYAFIGAGSVLTKSVQPFTLWYGNPAKHMGYVTKEGAILDLKLYDHKKNVHYKLEDNKLILQ